MKQLVFKKSGDSSRTAIEGDRWFRIENLAVGWVRARVMDRDLLGQREVDRHDFATRREALEWLARFRRVEA